MLIVWLPTQGFNQERTSLQNFSLNSPELLQHILFDLPTLLLLCFFHHGVLPPHFYTWEDVIQSEDIVRKLEHWSHFSSSLTHRHFPFPIFYYNFPLIYDSITPIPLPLVFVMASSLM